MEASCSVLRRPWLDLYNGQGLLAQRISVAAALCGDADDDIGALIPIELWLAVCSCFALDDFPGVCALARTCHTLRPLARHPQLWEKFCRAAFSLVGHLPSTSQLRFYGWSWLGMFRFRRRLRFDGVYYVKTTKLLAGLAEGRGMKEAGKDFYDPRGRWVTSYRVLRFFPCGRMFSYLCSTHTPEDARKLAQSVAPEWPRSLQRLKGACWGAFDAHEIEPRGGASGRLGLTARVLLVNDAYPMMAPATVRYVLELRAPHEPPANAYAASAQRAALADNSTLHLTALAIESSTGELESLPPPSSPCIFLPFEESRPHAGQQAPQGHWALASGQ